MNEDMIVIGWTFAYLSNYPTKPFTQERRKALIERIRKRRYNFTHNDHQFLSYTAPFYNDNTLCVLTKQEWDSVMKEAYKDIPCSARLIPQDVIDRPEINTVIYEKEKWEPKEGESNE